MLIMKRLNPAALLFAFVTFLSITLCGPTMHGQTNTVTAQHRSFPIPSSDSQPISITVGPDGNLWFTEQNRSQVARITPEGVITEFLTPTFSFPIDITPGPDGNIWFSEGSVGQIAFITPAGQIEEIPFSGFDAAGTTYDKATWNYEEGGKIDAALNWRRQKSFAARTLPSKSSCRHGTDDSDA